MSERGGIPGRIGSAFVSLFGGWTVPAMATLVLIISMVILFLANSLPVVPAYPFLIVNYSVALLLITAGLYALRYRMSGYSFDLATAVAVVSALLFYVYGAGLANQILVMNYNADVIERLDLLQHFASIVTGLVLIAGAVTGYRFRRIGRKEAIAWFAAAAAVSAVLMGMPTGVYGLNGLAFGRYLTSLEGWLHAIGITACVIAAAVLMMKRNWPYRYSVDGLIILLVMQALSMATASIQEGQFTLLWYVKGILLGQSFLFPFWGMVLDFLAALSQGNRLSMSLEDAGWWFLSSLSTPDRSYRPIETVARNFPEGISFSYTSSDGCNWKLEECIPATGETRGKMPESLSIDLRDRQYLEGPTVVTHEDERVNGDGVARLLGNGFMLTSNKVGDDMYRLVGVRQEAKVIWTQQEKRFLLQMASMYASSVVQKGIIEKRAHTVSQMLAMVQTTRILTNVGDDEGGGLDEVVGALVEMLGYESSSVWLLEKDDTLTATAWRWPEGISAERGKGTKLPAKVGIIGRAASERRPVLVNDTSMDGQYLNLFGETTKSELAIPILVDGQCYAVLDVQSSKRNAFEPLDQEVIATVARLLSMSVNLRRLYAQIRERGEIAEARNNLIAHDLRNILQALSTHVELIRIKGAGKQQTIADIDENLAALKNGILGAHRFLEEVLTIVKLEAGKIGTLGEYSLADIIDSSFGIIRESFPGRNIILDFDREGSRAYRITGTEFVKDVFMNLFSNSVKYSNGEETLIEVSASSPEAGGGRLIRVEVSDHGRGIEPARAKEVFDRFNKGAGGTGLGLPLVRQIMQSIGGSVSIRERVPGDYAQGTTFILEFRNARLAVDEELGFGIAN